MPKLRGRFSRSGFCNIVSTQENEQEVLDRGCETDLGSLLGTSLPLREGGRGDLLTGLRRLSLRRRHQQMFSIDW